jgi:hypothetical protein
MRALSSTVDANKSKFLSFMMCVGIQLPGSSLTHTIIHSKSVRRRQLLCIRLSEQTLCYLFVQSLLVCSDEWH